MREEGYSPSVYGGPAPLSNRTAYGPTASAVGNAALRPDETLGDILTGISDRFRILIRARPKRDSPIQLRVATRPFVVPLAVTCLPTLRAFKLHPEKQGVEHGDNSQRQHRRERQPEDDGDRHRLPHGAAAEPQGDQAADRGHRR